jgi:hypothetical protein
MLERVAALNAQLRAHEQRSVGRRRRLRIAAALGAPVLALLAPGLLIGFRAVTRQTAAPSTTTNDVIRPARIRPATLPPTATTVAGGRTPLAPPSTVPPSTVTLRVTASRGDCWVLARAGSRSGRVLYAAIVRRGTTIALHGSRLWVRFGAVGNLDLVLNGQQVRLRHTGTVDALLTPAGVDR